MRLIDADAVLAKIDERIKLVGLDTATKYGNETPEQADNSYQTWMKYEIADFVDDIRDEIVNAPTLEERPKGKWLSHYDYCAKHGVLPSSLITFWWCAQCEQAVEQPTNFCPNCGARMER